MEQTIEQPIPSGWVKAYDNVRQRHYYCNSSLGLTQWSHPSINQGSPKTTCTPCSSSLPAKEAEDKEEELFTGEGLYYKDPKDELQGPFSMEQVTAWRPFLPMDLQCWIFDAEDFQSKEASNQEDLGRKRPREDETSNKGGTDQADKTRAAVHKLIEVSPPIEFAELLGDGALLADYREAKSMGKVPESITAPSAAQWERAMLYGLNQHQAPSAAHQQGWRDEAAALAEAQEAGEDDYSIKASSLSYAEAVLSALPEDDEAVQLSKGKDLKQVILNGLHSAQASRRSASVPDGPPTVEVDFTSAQRNPLSGKLTAVGSTGANPRNHLYAELSRYANPEDIERQMAEAAAQRGKQLPPDVWKQLKARREEVKKKMKLAEFQRY